MRMDKENKKDEVVKEKEDDKKSKVADEDPTPGDKPDEDKEHEKPDLNAERMDRIERQLNRIERGGTAEAGLSEPKAKPLSDEEYGEKARRGEVNPLEEDGFI